RSDFQQLADVRIDEAAVLLAQGKFDGAYYLAGYAVECGLKACIARLTSQDDYPPKPKFRWCPTLAERPGEGTTPARSRRGPSARGPERASGPATARPRPRCGGSARTSRSCSCTTSGRSSPRGPASPC